MKTCVILIICIALITSCNNSTNRDEITKEIFNTEKAFEKMAAEKGVAYAFYFFADENAAIRRENDTLVIGKENIKRYYEKIAAKKSTCQLDSGLHRCFS